MPATALSPAQHVRLELARAALTRPGARLDAEAVRALLDGMALWVLAGQWQGEQQEGGHAGQQDQARPAAVEPAPVAHLAPEADVSAAQQEPAAQEPDRDEAAGRQEEAGAYVPLYRRIADALYPRLVEIARDARPCPGNADLLAGLDGIDPDTNLANVSMALRHMEDAGLIEVERRGGRSGPRRIRIIGTGQWTRWTLLSSPGRDADPTAETTETAAGQPHVETTPGAERAAGQGEEVPTASSPEPPSTDPVPPPAAPAPSGPAPARSHRKPLAPGRRDVDEDLRRMIEARVAAGQITRIETPVDVPKGGVPVYPTRGL